ncbi:hypothetical protein HYC85_005442 [Camellia sinensis]|uniref:Uncharacterized protein n=1 Tax=Camellia sinensis TaxID=4442 RepID=A0A7J7I0R0_CAMSI|nr:hypothetical protein HYC85_005442 [Camellia sinensis]
MILSNDEEEVIRRDKQGINGFFLTHHQQVGRVAIRVCLQSLNELKHVVGM